MAPLDRSALEAEITLLREQVAAQAALIEQLRREVTSLKKDSSNSSKPPSSDLIKPPKPRKNKRRRGKPGGSDHRRQRTAFPAEEVDRPAKVSAREGVRNIHPASSASQSSTASPGTRSKCLRLWVTTVQR